MLYYCKPYIFGFPSKKCPSQLNKKKKKKKSCSVCLKGGYLAGNAPGCKWGQEPQVCSCWGHLPVSGEQTANWNQYKPGAKGNIHSRCPRQTAEEAGRSVWLIIAKTDIYHWSHDQTTSEIRKHPSRAEGIEKPPLFTCSALLFCCNRRGSHFVLRAQPFPFSEEEVKNSLHTWAGTWMLWFHSLTGSRL